MGRDIGVQWALLPILLGVLIAFNTASKVSLEIGICIPIFSFIFLEIIDYQILIPAFAFEFSSVERSVILLPECICRFRAFCVYPIVPFSGNT